MSDQTAPRTAAALEKLRDGNGGIIWRVHPKIARDLELELIEAHSENLEQARLLGMSAEREASLLGKMERMSREIDNLKSDINKYDLDMVCALKERNDSKEQCAQLLERIDYIFSNLNGNN